MSDLIRRAYAIEAVCGDCTIEAKESCKRDGYCYEVRNLMALPSADAVQIVRCKDCKWHMNDYMGEWCGKLRGYPGMKANDFCSYGERREL